MKIFSREDFYKESSQIPSPDRQKELGEARRRSLILENLDRPSLLDALMVRLAGLSEEGRPLTRPRTLFIFGADSGISDEGGLFDRESPSTGSRLLDLAGGRGPISRLARATDSQIIPVNLGCRSLDLAEEGVVHAPVMEGGARNFAREDALTEETMMTAIRLGMEFAAQAASRGFRLLMAGRLSEASLLSATAILAALTGRDPQDLLDKGPGLDDEVFRRRIQVLNLALEDRAPQAGNPFDVLVKLGSLDIAALLGFYAGAALYGIPVLLDDLASLTGAFLTARLLPESRPFFFASHNPQSPASDLVLRELSLTPILDPSLAYGGGAGALLALPLLDLTSQLADPEERI